MKLNYLMGAVAACGLLAGAAYAQSTAPSDSTSGAPAPSSSSSMSSGASSSDRAPDASSSGAASATSSGQNASATTSAPGTMQPIPDTHENRKAFGGPNSNAGRRTAPKGN